MFKTVRGEDFLPCFLYFYHILLIFIDFCGQVFEVKQVIMGFFPSIFSFQLTISQFKYVLEF